MFLHFKQKILQIVMRIDGSCHCDVLKKITTHVLKNAKPIK